MTELLALDNVTAGYGDAIVIEGASLSLQDGESLAVLGRNGVGKTTLLMTLMGLTTLHRGTIGYRGKDLGALPVHKRASLGLGWVPQERGMFPSLTVQEHLTAVARPGPWNVKGVYRLFPALAERRSHFGNRLSGGEQQMLAIGRALVLNPRLLLLDEPTEGLAPIIVQDLKRIVRELVTEAGMAVILVEQHARLAPSLTRNAIVLERGRIAHRSPSIDLSNDRELLNRLLGVRDSPEDDEDDDDDEDDEDDKESSMSDALRTQGLSKHFGGFVANSSIDLRLPRGARHALIGPNGAGKTTFVNLLTGVLKPTAGDVFLGDERVTPLPQYERVKRGLTRTFQINTLFPGLTVLESVVLAICERQGTTHVWRKTVAQQREAIQEARELLERLLLSHDAGTITRLLSYGKQRLLEIALALATRPTVLLLDEPAAGVPSEDSAELFDVLERLPREVSVLLIEHDMDIVFRFAERIIVLANGSVLAEGSPEEIAADKDDEDD